ncbi:MAG: HAD superfamily hydrolase (TIGR01509 family) [Lysobacterales bacterium]|jgi:HAD superfamily hydrolase (TIGR01509 family)
MPIIKKVSAIFFDMDGTLVDSETLTEPTVVTLCEELGIENVDIDCTQFFGHSWLEIERRIIDYYPQLAGKADFTARMQTLFNDLLISMQPPLINGSREMLISASQIMPVAVVSSSGRESITETIRRMNVAQNVSFYAGFEDYEKCKPEPDGYLKAAEMLNIDPAECMVFEDSVAGIQSAKNAGMQVVNISFRCAEKETAAGLADMVVRDYTDLPQDFLESIRK